MQRLDYIFSYWLLLWYILYILKLVPFNPFWFILGGVVVNTLEIFLGQVDNIPYFVLVNVFLKIIPLYTLRGVKTTSADMYAGFVYLAMYIAWMKLNKEKILKLRAPLTDLLKRKLHKVA